MRRTSRRWRRPTTGGARRCVPRRPRFCAARGGALGIWLLDQVPTPFTVIGAVLVAIGLLMIGNVGWNTGQRQALALALTTGVVIGGYTLVDARAVEDVNGWAFFAMSSYLGATFAIIGNRLPIERLRARSDQVFPWSCLVDELCAHPVGLHPRRRSERGDAPLDLDPLRAALVRGLDPPAHRRCGGHGRWRGAGDAVGQRRGFSPRRPPAA